MSLDLVIIGGGPAGTGAGITAGAEGLKTVLVESRIMGGQSVHSARIHNYPGFPGGISGTELAERCRIQAEERGVDIRCPAKATTLVQDGKDLAVGLADGTTLVTRSVLLASGLSWIRHPAEGAEEFSKDKGVIYGAPSDRSHLPQEVVVVGGANSAGQAAVDFADHGCVVHLLVRADSLEKGMSWYLIQEMLKRPNIEVCLNTNVTKVRGNDWLQEVEAECGGEVKVYPAGLMSVFIGAKPKIDWLKGVVDLNDRNYILTGRRLGPRFKGISEREPMDFETSLPGVFSAGDIRSESQKRIAGAVGEAAVAVAHLFRYVKANGHGPLR